MSEVEDFLNKIKTWRSTDPKIILQVLHRLAQTKTFKLEELELLSKSLADFHKQIGKADENEVDAMWFQITINLKKKLKKMLETKEKEKARPKLQKKESSASKIPEELLVDRGPSEQGNLKVLYKSFFTNFQQRQEIVGAVVSFLRELTRQIKYMLQDKAESETIKRINSIANRLSKESSAEAKLKAISGQLKPSEMAQNNDEIYLDEKGRQAILELQRAKVEESLCGYYDDMKKKINSDAHERCVFCHKEKAFCEDMKQIRASDEPMTRFMRCNACGKAWRD